MNYTIKKIFTFLLFFVFVLLGYAQKSPTSTGLAKGLEYYNNGDIKDAIYFISNLIKDDSTNAEYHYWTGRCYEETADKDKALLHYLKSHKLNSKVSPDILYRIGRAYHQSLFFDDAVKYYKLYKKEINDEGAQKIKSTMMNEQIKATKRIHECENGKIIVAHPYLHKIYHLSGVINSEYPEYTPTVTADNKKMIFTSRRPGGISDKKDKDNGYFEDVWMSVKDSLGEWTTPINLGTSINTESHDASIALDAKGKELFLYRTDNAGDIYFSENINGSWTKPNPLKQVNSKHKEPSVCISANGKTIYFSSDRPGGYGGLDIYRCDKDKEGNWGPAVNMGSVVNSEYDEDSPFLSPDGRTLYFSSTGHNNMGGYDIFSVTYNPKTKTWGNPLNLGFPINSADDDIYFNISGDHRTAYYASAKKDGFGEKDIYMILIDSSYITRPLITVSLGSAAPSHIAAVHPSTLKHHEGQHHVKPHGHHATTHHTPHQAHATTVASANIVQYKGTVLDEEQHPIESNIKVKKENSNEKAKEYHTAADGTFSIPLEKGFQYGIDIEKDGYIFASNNIDLSLKSTKSMPVIEEKIVLAKPKVGAKIVMRNIFYATGSASLDMDSFDEIDILYHFMVKNPSVKIEISGHTDNKGSTEINKELSTSRARAIYKLLVKKGIEGERIKYVGYGSERPIADNNSESGRKKNRRTEFEILYQ